MGAPHRAAIKVLSSPIRYLLVMVRILVQPPRLGGSEVMYLIIGYDCSNDLGSPSSPILIGNCRRKFTLFEPRPVPLITRSTTPTIT